MILADPSRRTFLPDRTMDFLRTVLIEVEKTPLAGYGICRDSGGGTNRLIDSDASRHFGSAVQGLGYFLPLRSESINDTACLIGDLVKRLDVSSRTSTDGIAASRCKDSGRPNHSSEQMLFSSLVSPALYEYEVSTVDCSLVEHFVANLRPCINDPLTPPSSKFI